jgi:Ca-activated chloride channel family protein
MSAGGYQFANPEFFWFLLLIPLLAWWYWRPKNRYFPAQTLSSLLPFDHGHWSWRHTLNAALPVFRLLAMSFLIIALARPQSVMERQEVDAEAIDIMIAMDISSSMLARDFEPNRLGAAKKVAKDFISGRRNDRIGLVVFAAESFTQCPLTTDYQVLENLLKETESGLIEDGTAIGMGLANGVNRLKKSSAESKVLILLTDGVNNRGSIDPMTAQRMAQKFGITVYTIGIGSEGTAPFPYETPHGKRFKQKKVNIDEKLLTTIANKTGGQYFRATSSQKLRRIYEEIDKMEKTKINVSSFRRYDEEFLPFALIAAGLLGVELISRYGLLKRLP